MHSTETRCVIGPEKNLPSAGASVHFIPEILQAEAVNGLSQVVMDDSLA